MITNLFRYQKEVPPASHLSPVKKRVKENTPPDHIPSVYAKYGGGVVEWSTLAQQSTSGKSSKGRF